MVLTGNRDWCFYLQADEVVHERDLERIAKAMRENISDGRVDGIFFHWNHFYGDYKHFIRSYHWYQREIRIIRSGIGVKSRNDAQGFEIKGENNHE